MENNSKITDTEYKIMWDYLLGWTRPENINIIKLKVDALIKKEKITNVKMLKELHDNFNIDYSYYSI